MIFPSGKPLAKAVALMGQERPGRYLTYSAAGLLWPERYRHQTYPEAMSYRTELAVTMSYSPPPPSSTSTEQTGEKPWNHYWVDGVMLTSVAVFGLVGTLMAIRVLLRPNLRNSFSTLLAVLAVCDIMVLILAVPLFGLPNLNEWWVCNSIKN